MGILIVGTISASILITSKEKISDVNIISAQLLCDKLFESSSLNYEKYCVRQVIKGKRIIIEPIEMEFDISNSPIDIDLVKINNQTVYEVKAK